MAEAPPPPNGSRPWPRPVLPTMIVAIAVLVALVSVSGLLYLLYTRTTGPGQVLREFAERVEVRDCRGSYALLDPSVQVDPETWCRGLDRLAAQVDPGFDLVRVVLEGDVALVRVENPDGEPQAWELQREGRSWRILRPRQGPAFPG